MQTFGIDISHWQGVFDFNKAIKEGVKFVILKCGGGDSGLYEDSKFDAYYRQCQELGIDVGVYFFGYANTVDGVKAEANKCVEILKGKTLNYPVFYDIEASHSYAGSKDTTSALVKTFCEIIEVNGRWAGFYTNEDWYYNKLNGAELAKRFVFWLASWRKTMPSIPNVQMWQFGGETNYIRSNKIAGVVCDQDYSFVDFPSIIGGKTTMTEADKAKKWAIDNGLIVGIGNGDYAWKHDMTREQFVLLLYRFYYAFKNGKLK